ncbi:MAG: biotin/lipoate A/B protein ligase family protein [Tenuifilum sp.]|uniref:lipoate--protein ligase family protein n=1 Tax=Tenuifilum sp. TaxID=2760880 RepID=UPI0030B53CC6
MKKDRVWRLVADDISEPAMHFAMEEALLRLTDEDHTQPTLRIRRVEPSVWIGYYQLPTEDVDVDYCKKHNLKIVRRMNSGGAVYQDEGTFCYSAFFQKEDFFKTFNIDKPEDLYPLFGSVIIDLCKTLDIDATLSPVNDITVNGRKIYGSAQLDWYSAFVHSGSILVDVNRNIMQDVLRPSNLKFADKGFKNVKDRVINLAEVSSKPIEVNKVIELFKTSFQKVLNVILEPGHFTAKEKALATQLYNEKYSQKEWTFNQFAGPQSMVSVKIPSGVLTLKYELANARFKTVSLHGDFLLPNHNEAQRFESNCTNKTPLEVVQELKNINLPTDLKEGIMNLLYQINNNGTR